MLRNVIVFGLAVSLSGCPGMPIPGVPGGDDAVVAKYDRWLDHVAELQASVEDAERWVVDAPKELAVALGLPEDATLDQISAAIQEKIQSGVIAVGGSVSLTVNVDAGASASGQAGTGGASGQAEAHASVEVIIVVEGGIEVSAEVQQVIDAVKVCIERVAGIKPRLEAIVANVTTVVTEGAALLQSLPDDFQGVMAAKIAEYTAKIQGALDFLGGVAGSVTVTVEVSVEVQGSVSGGLTGE
jgi:hypothetical protein